MVNAYHFVGATLRYGPPIPADGEWLIHEGPVVICKTGLHASLHPFDALQYAPGATLCMVECEDIVTKQPDKFVCRRRRIVKRIDATELLWKASRQYALSVIHLWNAPEVVREYLETGDESKRAAARAAVLDAAWAAALDAAWDAARAAAWAAARAAAGAAAWDAPGAAAWDAAWAAAWDAAWDAARAAAWDAAWDAARAAQRDLFSRLVMEYFNGR